ncbi:DUF3892 domain-containing protein [Flavobacterium eburneipallidum]|uniref:DUF3892 domain-containing protein n=1 Tax=Flavobacterium eburneipallidum TaxID=3003263 RepID=UPI0022AC41B8|nr:DUF3892 domain-containing protein [Flavobacterium eburneipallidum]
MATSHEIRCINKSDRTNIHERIVNIGGINEDRTRWKISQSDAIAAIEANKWQFYVGQGVNKVDVIISESAAGYKYLKTKNDTTTSNNLLNLPECP